MNNIPALWAQRESRGTSQPAFVPKTPIATQPTNITNTSSVQKDEIAQTQDVPLDVPWELDL